MDLTMAERSGVEIDYCPKCRGVWLDRGELDKIIDRSASTSPPAEYADREYSPETYKRRKRKSFLSDIFDFD
jgi:Zn-finger nucleic acid-binding protein